MQVFADGYRLTQERLLASIELIAPSCEHVCRAIDRQAAAGEPAALGMIEDGARAKWAADAEYARARQLAWRRAISRERPGGPR